MLENELDDDDPLQNYVGELNGETLLAMCYSISSKTPQDPITIDTTLQKISTLNPIDSCNNQQNDNRSIRRPSYPMLRYSHVVDVSKLSSFILHMDDRISVNFLV